jgi:Ca2+-transporting ATPase
MSDLVFVGMVGLIDPPRDGIRDAVLTLLSTGSHLKMVTGDAEETALAIG